MPLLRCLLLLGLGLLHKLAVAELVFQPRDVLLRSAQYIPLLPCHLYGGVTISLGRLNLAGQGAYLFLRDSKPLAHLVGLLRKVLNQLLLLVELGA